MTTEALGVRSALSLAVPWNALDVGRHVGQRAVGAVNLDATTPRAFAGPESKAVVFGSCVASGDRSRAGSDTTRRTARRDAAGFGTVMDGASGVDRFTAVPACSSSSRRPRRSCS